jgi:hypothetical protein
MTSPNGHAVLGPRRLRVTYDTLTYTVAAPDGETAALAGYRRGAGCPISVEIEVEGAYAEYSEDRPSDEDQASMTTERYVAIAMRAARLLRRNLLCAVLPGLDRQVADVLAADGGPWESILVELDWWDAPGATTKGEVHAGVQSPSTGSPASPDSSAPTTGSRSRTAKP